MYCLCRLIITAGSPLSLAHIHTTPIPLRALPSQLALTRTRLSPNTSWASGLDLKRFVILKSFFIGEYLPMIPDVTGQRTFLPFEAGMRAVRPSLLVCAH